MFRGRLFPPTHSDLLTEIDLALARVVLPGWSIRRLDTTRWEIVCQNEPSGAWHLYYSVIAFASPRSVLVLHGNHERMYGMVITKEILEGRLMVDIWSTGMAVFDVEFKTLDAFLSAQFRDHPPNIRQAKPRPPSPPLFLDKRSLEEIIHSKINALSSRERFHIKHDAKERTFQLVVKEKKSASGIYFDYRIVVTEEPECVLVFSEGCDDRYLAGRSEHVAYIPREDVNSRDWLEWVLRNRQPNGHEF